MAFDQSFFSRGDGGPSSAPQQQPLQQPSMSAALAAMRVPALPARVDITRALGAEYVVVANDIARTVAIQVFVQLLLAMCDPEASFFSASFWVVLVFLVIGTLCHHLVLKGLVVFV